jgi:transcriptional regulator with XRE-family HTH domain
MAVRLRVSVERVSRIEREGNLTVHTIVSVANALGVEAVELWREPDAEPEREGKRGRGRPRKMR